ncbi:MAG: DUF3016 domain-containing protein [Gammaproteobacteria bacterium]
MNLRFVPFALAALSTPAFAAGVTVEFTNPDKYTDAKVENSSLPAAQASLQKRLREYLRQLGQRYLPDDQALTIDVLDIDLAGRFEPWRPNADTVRFMVSTTWPSMKLRYEVRGPDGKTLASGTETVMDQDYLRRPNQYSESDTLRYEKRMLDTWFDAKFGRPRGQHAGLT